MAGEKLHPDDSIFRQTALMFYRSGYMPHGEDTPPVVPYGLVPLALCLIGIAGLVVVLVSSMPVIKHCRVWLIEIPSQTTQKAGAPYVVLAALPAGENAAGVGERLVVSDGIMMTLIVERGNILNADVLPSGVSRALLQGEETTHIWMAQCRPSVEPGEADKRELAKGLLAEAAVPSGTRSVASILWHVVVR